MSVVTKIEIYRVAMPLVYPFRTAFGDDDTIESILLRMEWDGAAGWGESAPWRCPAYSPECAAGAFLVIRDFLAPLVLGQRIESGRDLQQCMAQVKGNPFAKAALDLAWWDCYAQRRGAPLARTLGGVGDTVTVGADFGIMESVDLLLDTIDQALGQGFRRIKLKYRPGWDLPMITAVRNRFPDAVVHIDCNSAYTLADSAMFEELDGLGLAMIEQPLAHDDLADHAALQARLSTPICLDESITSLAKARKALDLEACRWINIKPGRVGGLTNAVAIHDVCAAAGVPCWVGGMLESAVGAAHCVALATLPNFSYPADIFPSERFYVADLGTPPIVLSGPSEVAVREAAGSGAEPDMVRLEKLTLESAAMQV